MPSEIALFSSWIVRTRFAIARRLRGNLLAMQLAQGQVIAERYRLERLLGEGGMGAVWSAVHLVTRKPVALKFIKADGAKSPQARRRFLREARAASAVRHPNVVQVHDILELGDGSPVMVMDLLEGETLAERLARESQLSLGDTARILVPVISAVGTAHSAGVVHRDLKPDNIFLARAPKESTTGSLDVKVLDFGIAKFTSAELEAQTAGGLTQTGAMLGTPYYMSPEQAFGEHDIDHRADVWALAIIIYECLVGRRPIEGDNVGQIIKVIVTRGMVALDVAMPSLPRDVTDLVARMLVQKRDDRLGDLREAAAILRKYTDVAYASFEGPKPVIDPVSSKKLIESGETIEADPFARTTDISGQNNAATVTENAHVVARTELSPSPPPSKRWMLVAIGAAAAIAVVAFWRFGLTPTPTQTLTPTQTQTPTPTQTQTLAPTPSQTPATPASTEPTTSAAPIATHKKPQATPTVTATATASVLPGGVVGKAPF
jgi:serine/threonine-protein kinase